MIGGLVILIILILAIAIVASCIKIVPQAQAYVVERLGAYQDTWSVGLHFKVPIVDKVAKRVLLKEQVADFPPQPVITNDADRYRCLFPDHRSQAVYLRS